MRILVTQSEMKHSLGMIRSLARQGHHVYGLVDPLVKQPLSAYSRYCRQIIPANQREESAFVHHVMDAIKTVSADVLVPVGYPVTHFVVANQAKIAERVSVVVPSVRAEETAIDKFEIQQRASQWGVPSPKTMVLHDRKDIDDVCEKLGFPVVMKGRKESGRGIVAIASTRDEAYRRFDRLVGQYGLRDDELPIFQEYIPGWGCGFFAIYDAGRCKRVFMHKRIREYPPTGGASCCAESFRDPRLSEYGTRLLDGLGWNGVAMVEFRYDERTRDYKLIEVNAKFWGSLELALAAGADFPGDYVKIATGQPTDFVDAYRQMTYQWFLSGDLLHGLRRPSALPGILGTVLDPRVRKDFLVLDDPKLVLMKAYKTLKEIGGLALRRGTL